MLAVVGTLAGITYSLGQAPQPIEPAPVPGTLGKTRVEKIGDVQLFERRVATGLTAQPEITIVLRLPAGHSAETPTARGILAFCTWQKETETLKQRLADDSGALSRFADKHGLALVTWNTETLWKTGRSHDQIGRAEAAAQRRNFDAVARAWSRGVTAICKEFDLPESGILLYGISRGAHYAQRLALRLPDRFLAVHIHVANSYDKPTSKAGSTLWLVTSGDLDRGRHNALSYYHESRKAGIPMVLKVANGLGHAGSPQIDRLRDAFFEYALRLRMAGENQGRTPAQLMSEALENPPAVGEVLSQQVFPSADAVFVPERQRIDLPSAELAHAWSR